MTSPEFAAGRRPTEARIDLSALRENWRVATSRAGARRVIAVVKTDAYGHGAAAVARTLASGGCDDFAVMTVGEAAALRAAGIAGRILVLGGAHDAAEAAEAVARGATAVVHHAGQIALMARAAAERGTRAPVHVEVDTGMRRMGVREDEAAALLAAVAADPALRLDGTYTHLACADEAELDPSREQLRRFADVIAAVRAAGVDPGLVHVANSAALLQADALSGVGPEAAAVRPGLMLYGVAPAPHLVAPLRPVMTLRARVAAVRRVAPGETVGYGATHRARKATTIATLPLGYADGVPWSAANRGSVLLQGRRAPIVGRVSMDFVTVDAGESPARVGDEAIVFGEGQGARLPVEEAATAAGTLAYELLVRVGSRVPRVVVGD